MILTFRQMVLSVLVVALMAATMLPPAGPLTRQAYAGELWSSVPESFGCERGDNGCISHTGFNPLVSTWGQFANVTGNCTNYAAYRVDRNGAPKPWGSPMGNAVDWKSKAEKAGFVVNTTPAVGAVAWWGTSRGADGHVGYVEAVDGSTVYVSESIWGQGSSRIVYRSGESRYPEYFLHVFDAPTSTTGSNSTVVADFLDSDLQPITGDWNGDGKDDIGLRRVSTGMFYLRTGPSWSQSVVSWSSGAGSDLQPITGDWNGDGKDDIGLRRVSTGMFYLRTGPSWSQSVVSWSSGAGSDLQPITGDWNGDGKDDIGLRRVSTGMFYLRTGPSWSQSVVSWSSGAGSDLQPITGDWNGDGKDDIGLRRVSTGKFYFVTPQRLRQSTVSWSSGAG